MAELRTEPYGCTEDDMARSLTSGEDGSQRCEDLGSVAGQTTGGEPGDVEARANAIAAALNETRTVRGQDGRLEPLGVAVTVQVTVTGLEGEEADVTWSLRHGDGGRLPHVWLRNRPVIHLTGEAESDSGSAEFWVPLPKRPRGPDFVRIGMYDDDGTPLTFANTTKVDPRAAALLGTLISLRALDPRATSTREETSSLRNRLRMWVSTVLRLRNSSAAISRWSCGRRRAARPRARAR